MDELLSFKMWKEKKHNGDSSALAGLLGTWMTFNPDMGK